MKSSLRTNFKLRIIVRMKRNLSCVVLLIVRSYSLWCLPLCLCLCIPQSTHLQASLFFTLLMFPFVFTKNTDISKVTSLRLINSWNLTAMQYFILTDSPYSNFYSCTSNVLCRTVFSTQFVRVAWWMKFVSLSFFNLGWFLGIPFDFHDIEIFWKWKSVIL